MQWKAGGAYVGAWNMLVYFLSMFVMEKSSGNDLSIDKTNHLRDFFFKKI